MGFSDGFFNGRKLWDFRNQFVKRFFQRNIDVDRTFFLETKFHRFFDEIEIGFICAFLSIFQKLKVSIRMLRKNLFLANGLPIKNIHKIGWTIRR
ncbi:hypothetical protein SDC9_165251 [bioreactor metagenome]|uniref:Uncharacterized protein n=1 Tax=bioreactor metagenome TaxID=1076179 RepID=A0A645FVP8_9ZZZZ